MDDDNILDKIQEMYGNRPEKFSILEEQIDVNLQMQYFEQSQDIREDINIDEETESILKNKDLLYDESISIEEKRILLIKLATLEKVEAFRVIEKFLEKADKDLRSWVVLALQESRMKLESSLLDEDQLFISTGLGGKGSKLRYFAVIIHKNDESFSDVQKKIFNNEFDFLFTKKESEIEAVEFKDHIATITCLVPINVSLRELFKNVITECNQYGNFIDDNFILTNVRVLSHDQIIKFLSSKDKKSALEDIDKE